MALSSVYLLCSYVTLSNMLLSDELFKAIEFILQLLVVVDAARILMTLIFRVVFFGVLVPHTKR